MDIFPDIPVPSPAEPCKPSPCGPNSQCRVVNDQAVCSCLTSYIGIPPACRPECLVSAECSPNNACINQKCSDPCPGTRGINTHCEVINHSPICSCKHGFTGDPSSRCSPILSKINFLYLNTSVCLYYIISLKLYFNFVSYI